MFPRLFSTDTSPLSGTLCALLLLTGCRDVEPVVGSLSSTTSIDKRDGGPVEEEGCQACLLGQNALPPVCAEPLAACGENEKCAALLRCVLDAECLNLHTEEGINECSFPCFLHLGLISPAETSVQLIIGVGSCGQQNCPDVCY